MNKLAAQEKEGPPATAGGSDETFRLICALTEKPEEVSMKNRTTLSITLFSLLILVSATTSSGQRAPITGDWRMEFSAKNPDEIQLTMSRGKKQSWGHAIKISEVQGLARNYETTAGEVTLRIVRDGGTFDLTGRFSAGIGSGVFTLTPNESFLAALAARGYPNLSDDNIFSAAMSGLKISSIDELKAAGYDRLTFNNLMESAIFKIDAAQIADLRSAGFDQLPFNKLVEASIFKVDSSYAREVESLGFGKVPFQKLVELRVQQITPEYISQVRQLGFNDLTIDRLVEFKIFKVTPEFVSEMRAAGFTTVTPQQLVSLRIFNIDGDYARKAKSEDPNLTVEKLVEQRIFEKHSSRTNQ